MAEDLMTAIQECLMHPAKMVQGKLEPLKN
jgi:hypothetical protein